jgi:hypothetical protein
LKEKLKPSTKTKGIHDHQTSTAKKYLKKSCPQMKKLEIRQEKCKKE